MTSPYVRWVRRTLLGLLGFAMIPVIGTATLKRNRELGLKLIKPWDATMRLHAGKRFSFLAILEHRGRRSGRAYTTALSSVAYRDGFILPLVYGADVDWCRNVLANGCAVLNRRGQSHQLVNPEVIALDSTGAPGLSLLGRITTIEAQQGLWLHHATDASPKG